jgi:hypothetical protein
MLNIKLREDLCKFAWDTVKKRNFGNRSIGANGNKEQQYTGILGETVIYDIVYGKLPEYNEAGIVDIVINGKKIDIKTMGRTVYMKPDYVHNFMGYQKDFPNDIYMFNSIVKNERIIQICGWLPKEEFFMRSSSFFDKGMKIDLDLMVVHLKAKAPLYEIENKELNAVSTEEDVRKIGL